MLIDLVALVDDRLKVFDLDEAFEDGRKLGPCEPTIVEQRAVHRSVVNEFARFCQTLTLAIADHIVLQAERLPVYFVQYRQEQVMSLLTLGEVLDHRVCRIFLTGVTFFHLLIVLHSFDELISFLLDSTHIFVTRALEETLKFILVSVGQSRLSCPFLMRLIKLLPHAIPELLLDEVLQSLMLDRVRKSKHRRHVGFVGVAEIDVVCDLAKVLRVLVDLLQRVGAFVLVAPMRLVHRDDAFHVLITFGHLIIQLALPLVQCPFKRLCQPQLVRHLVCERRTQRLCSIGGVLLRAFGTGGILDEYWRLTAAFASLFVCRLLSSRELTLLLFEDLLHGQELTVIQIFVLTEIVIVIIVLFEALIDLDWRAHYTQFLTYFLALSAELSRNTGTRKLLR